MKAVLIQNDKSLVWADVPNPIMGAADALVKIEYAALNRADLLQREGNYPPPPGCPDWMGLEISGTIVDLGEEAKEKSNYKVGDKVCALLSGGGYAEYANIRYDMRPGGWPRDGVYAGVACVRNELYLCVLNQGRHPTAPEGIPTVEAHLLDYSGGPLYGEKIVLEYLHYLRPETAFSSLELLKEQLRRDKQNARDWALAFPTLLDSIVQKERS